MSRASVGCLSRYDSSRHGSDDGDGYAMRCDEALRILRAQRPELDRFHVGSLELFGSVARDDAGPDSDVDLLVEYDQIPTLFQIIELEDFLTSVLGTRVDLVLKDDLRERVRSRVVVDALPV